MVNRYCIMYKYNSINHTNEKTEAFYCLKNNYDKEKTKYYTSSLSDNRNHIIVFLNISVTGDSGSKSGRGDIKDLLPIAEQCREMGFTEELTRLLAYFQPVGFRGNCIHGEHREKSGTAYSTATVKRNPQKKGKFRLCIDGMPILEWFKMNLKSLRKSWL